MKEDPPPSHEGRRRQSKSNPNQIQTRMGLDLGQATPSKKEGPPATPTTATPTQEAEHRPNRQRQLPPRHEGTRRPPAPSRPHRIRPPPEVRCPNEDPPASQAHSPHAEAPQRPRHPGLEGHRHGPRRPPPREPREPTATQEVPVPGPAQGSHCVGSRMSRPTPCHEHAGRPATANPCFSHKDSK